MTDASKPSEQPLWNPPPGTPLPPRTRARTGGSGQDWSAGLVFFGAVVMLVDGIFGLMRGIMGIAHNQVFVTTPNYAFHFNLTAWGWIQAVLGVLLVAVGYCILRGAAWARLAGICLASLSVLANLLSLPYFPLWSLIGVALDLAVIWALCAYQPDRAAD
jgi:hypothetical protein